MLDELLWKARFLVDGIRIAPGALEGVGSRYKEQLHHLFEYDFDVHGKSLSPAEFRLPGGRVVQVRVNERSPYEIRRENGVLIASDAGRPVTAIEWLERPAYYTRKTSQGLPMTGIAEMVGMDCVSVCHTNFCLTFANGKQCAFCNMNFNPRQYDDVLIRKRAAEVGEAIHAAFEEGIARHFLITGGILPGNQEMEILARYLESIRERTGMESLPGSVILTPPEDLRQIERLRRLGLQGIGFNLECYDRAYFRAVCPGKAERIGYEKYREALRVAVEIFGSGGTVFSGFVAGIEPMDLLLEGVQELAEEGVASIPLVWSPSAGTRFHGHRPPCAEWFVEMTRKTAAILIRHMKRPPDGVLPKPLRCERCQNQCLLHDVMRGRRELLRAVTAV